VHNFHKPIKVLKEHIFVELSICFLVKTYKKYLDNLAVYLGIYKVWSALVG